MNIISAIEAEIVNIITLDQVLNFGASLLLLSLAILVYRRLPNSRGLGAALIVLSAINIPFYAVAIFTTVNETYRLEFSSLSGYRSLLTLAILCGLCYGLLRIGQRG